MTDRNFRYDLDPVGGGGGGEGTPSCDFNGDVRPDRVWFSKCSVLNGVSISSLSTLNRVSPLSSAEAPSVKKRKKRRGKKGKRGK